MDKEAIEKIKCLIKRCNKCKLKQCENCEISWNEVQAIEEILKYIEDLEETNEYQSELINDTYINYNDLEFTRLKRRNRELEQEIEELKKKPVNDIPKQIMNEEIDIDSIEEVIEKYFKGEEFRYCGLLIHKKLNELIKAVKQINNKLKENKK